MPQPTEVPTSRGVFAELGRLARADGMSEQVCSRLCGAWARELGALTIVLTLFDENGEGHVIGAAESATAALATAQFRLGEGPCVDVRRDGRPVLADLDSARRWWPAWTAEPAASELGSVASLPLATEGAQQPMGTLWSCFKDSDAMPVEGLGEVWALATLVARQATTQRELVRCEALSAQLQHALDSRVVIEQAKGFLAARDGLALSEAFERLRRHARNEGRRLHEVAREVVAGAKR